LARLGGGSRAHGGQPSLSLYHRDPSSRKPQDFYSDETVMGAPRAVMTLFILPTGEPELVLETTPPSSPAKLTLRGGDSPLLRIRGKDGEVTWEAP
jgi:hypothetical protein